MGTSEKLAEERELNNWELKQPVKSGLYPNEQTALRSALWALFQEQTQTLANFLIK